MSDGWPCLAQGEQRALTSIVPKETKLLCVRPRYCHLDVIERSGAELEDQVVARDESARVDVGLRSLERGVQPGKLVDAEEILRASVVRHIFGLYIGPSGRSVGHFSSSIP